MPRKLKLSSRQSAILRMLEEAGAESFDTIFPTVELEDFDELERDIGVLRSLGLVSFFTDLGSAETRYAVMTDEEISRMLPLRDLYLHDDSRTHGLLLTDSGNHSLTT